MSLKHGKGNNWMKTPATPDGVIFSKFLWDIAVKLSLGIPVDHVSGKCIWCNAETDRFGIYALICKHCRGVIAKHNNLVKTIYNLSLRAGLDV